MDAPNEPGRKHLPHLPPREFPNQSVIIYVTQVVVGRRGLLARSEAVETILNAWRRADHWLVGRYVIMPDHLHVFVSAEGSRSLSKWAGSLKNYLTACWRLTGEAYAPA